MPTLLENFLSNPNYQAVADISLIDKTTSGKVIFYDDNGFPFVAISEEEEVFIDLGDKSLFFATSRGFLYKFTVFSLTSVDGRPYTAISQLGNSNQNDYTQKLRDVYEDLMTNVFVGCCECGSGSSGILWYDTFGDFPVTGVVDTLYVDKATPALYFWDGAAYVAFTSGVSSVTGYSVDNTDPANPIVKAIPTAGTDALEPVTGDVEYFLSNSRKAIKMTDGLREYLVWFLGISNQMRVGNFLASNPTFGSYAAFLDDYIDLISGDSVNGQVAMRLYQLQKTIEVSTTTSNFKGITYGADYSADMVLRSLIDQEVLKKRFWTKAGTPTTTDDSTQGFVVGSLVYDTTNDILYRCTSNSASAATWTVEYNAAKNKSYEFFTCTSAIGLVFPASATRFYTVTGVLANASITNSAFAATQLGVAGTLKGLTVITTTAQPASGSQVWEIFAGSNASSLSATGITLTIAAGAAAGSFTTATTFNTSAGDYIAFREVNNATANSATLASVSTYFEISNL